MEIQAYKVADQRVWPFPKQIEKGPGEYVVKGRLCLSRDGSGCWPRNFQKDLRENLLARNLGGRIPLRTFWEIFC